MPRGKLTISIDLELAWGVWDKLSTEQLQLAETQERPICTALIELFDRYSVPATWAVVAGLLHEASSNGKPGPKVCWYAPDIIEQIIAAAAKHEIGSHGGRHIYFDAIPVDAALDDLKFAKDVHRAHGLPFTSLVFPRNAAGHYDMVARIGLRVYRGPDQGWFCIASGANNLLGRITNLADKMLPIPPQPILPRLHNGLIDVPGSMLLLGRNGARRFVLPAISRAKLSMGLARASQTGGVFHLWFHPSNFYYRRLEQLETLAWFLEQAANAAGRGQVDIVTMASFCNDVGHPALIHAS